MRTFSSGLMYGNLVEYAVNFEVGEESGGEVVVVAVDIYHVVKLTCAKFFKNVSLTHLTCAKEYEGFAVTVIFPSEQLGIYGSLHCCVEIMVAKV